MHLPKSRFDLTHTLQRLNFLTPTDTRRFEIAKQYKHADDGREQTQPMSDISAIASF